MAQSSRSARFDPTISSSGVLLIAIGLAVLILAAWIPTLPVVTAMAILTLGATNSTIVRFQATATLRPILLLHAVTYALLYALFIGATLHAVGAASTASLSRWVLFDVAVSTLPMALAAQRIVGARRHSPELKR